MIYVFSAWFICMSVVLTWLIRDSSVRISHKEPQRSCPGWHERRMTFRRLQECFGEHQEDLLERSCSHQESWIWTCIDRKVKLAFRINCLGLEAFVAYWLDGPVRQQELPLTEEEGAPGSLETVVLWTSFVFRERLVLVPTGRGGGRGKHSPWHLKMLRASLEAKRRENGAYDVITDTCWTLGRGGGGWPHRWENLSTSSEIV